MKIQSYDRVVYRHNPLVEVVCQARFVRMADLTSEDGFISDLAAAGYTKVKETPPFSVQIRIEGAPGAPGNLVGGAHPVFAGGPPIPTFARATEDDVWSLTFNAESVSLICTSYPSWDVFMPRFVEAVELYNKWFPGSKSIRLGLRYRDLIDRDKLGLQSCSWNELIHPFLLGGMSEGVFREDEVIPEQDVQSSLTQTMVKLDDCSLIIQGALLRAVLDQAKTVFLIDADYHMASADIENLATSEEGLQRNLDVLHEHAGAMFRRGIKEKLHVALDPNG